ncbi:hypothetical protein RvY_02414-2 [Ramazzottius varieornatus]|uniref:Uncharacterized protein n=1 Tax=Ramazzottius varieornatus TaxID=947166 RepID=A0A1D1UQI5_RAMVA|nr:hypothetical protein RvY_02414-2 [Ramazzottius varieornatus]
MARYLRIALFAACVALMLTTSMGAPQPNGRFRPISISSLRTTTSTTPRTTSTTRRHSGHPYPDPYPFPAPAYLYLQRGDAQRMQVGGPKDIGHSPLTTKRTTTSTTRRGPGGKKWGCPAFQRR